MGPSESGIELNGIVKLSLVTIYACILMSIHINISSFKEVNASEYVTLTTESVHLFLLFCYLQM